MVVTAGANVSINGGSVRLARRVLGHILVATIGLAAANVEAEEGYRVQAGDVLAVSVWKEEGLEREVLVRPDGGLSFPLVGDIQASGKTVQSITEEIAARIGKFIPDPVVTVTIQQILGNKIYVIGKVNNPGQFIVNPNVDVMQALSMAGGMNPFASSNNIRILRRVDGKQQAIPFRYGDVEDGNDLAQNIMLRSGDIVVVP